MKPDPCAGPVGAASSYAPEPTSSSSGMFEPNSSTPPDGPELSIGSTTNSTKSADGPAPNASANTNVEGTQATDDINAVSDAVWPTDLPVDHEQFAMDDESDDVHDPWQDAKSEDLFDPWSEDPFVPSFSQANSPQSSYPPQVFDAKHDINAPAERAIGADYPSQVFDARHDVNDFQQPNADVAPTQCADAADDEDNAAFVPPGEVTRGTWLVAVHRCPATKQDDGNLQDVNRNAASSSCPVHHAINDGKQKKFVTETTDSTRDAASSGFEGAPSCKTSAAAPCTVKSLNENGSVITKLLEVGVIKRKMMGDF